MSDSAKVTGELVITESPLTVPIPLTDAFQREMLAALSDEGRTIKLYVRGVIPPKELSVTDLAVYVEKTDATASSSFEDAHYVDSRSFGEKVANPKAHHYILDVKAALKRSGVNLAELKQLRFTFVPLSNGAKAPEGTRITVKELQLSVVSTKQR